MELTQDQINQLKSKGLNDAKISELAKQNGYTLPTPKSLTQGQISQMKASGLDDTKIQTLAKQNGYTLPEAPGGVQSFVQAVAKPFAKVGATLYGGAVGAGTLLGVPGASEARQKLVTQGVDLGYLGNVKPIGGEALNKLQSGEIGKGAFVGKSALDLLGTAAEIGSYAVGGGGLTKTAATGLRGQIARGALEGFMTGIKSGGLMSFGQAVQEADAQPMETAYKTLFGAGVGGVLGAPLGAIAPIVVKGKNLTKRFTNIDQINEELYNLNNRVFKPTASKLEKWSAQNKDPIKTYTEIFGTDLPQVGKDNRFTRESINDFVQRVDNVYKPAAEGFNQILRNSPEVNSITAARNRAISNLDRYNLTPAMYEKAVTSIDNNFNSIKNRAIKDGVLLGDDSIPVYYSDQLKDKFWGATKNFGTEDATIANSVNSSIGHGFKDSIENSIQDLNVRNYNKKLGDLIVLRDYLQTKAGALAGTGGKMTRLMARVAGTVAGSSGGPIGSIIGTLTGDKLAQIMIDPALQPYRWLINKKLQQLPQAEIMQLEQEANAVLQKMFEKKMESATFYSLPSPEYQSVGGVMKPFIRNQTVPMVTPAPTTYEAPAQKIMNESYVPKVNPQKRLMGAGQNPIPLGGATQPLSTSESMLPTTKPTMSVNTKNNIPVSSPIKSDLSTNAKNVAKVSSEQSLLQEARKYKSAEEFVKAQGKPLYHGTVSGNSFDNFDLSKSSTGIGGNAFNQGAVAYLTESPKAAKVISYLVNEKQAIKNVNPKTLIPDSRGFGDVLEFRIPNSAKIAKPKPGYRFTTKDITNLKKQGYDGAIIPDKNLYEVTLEGRPNLHKMLDNTDTTVVWNTDILQSKNKLTDIWKKANGKLK